VSDVRATPKSTVPKGATADAATPTTDPAPDAATTKTDTRDADTRDAGTRDAGTRDAAKSEPSAIEAEAEAEAERPPLVLPPWLPAPGTAFFQPTITDARLFPVRHAMGWFEGPVHQVFIEHFKSTHSKQHGLQLYGRFVGQVHGYFALPPAPRPEAAERLVQAFRDLPEDAIAPDRTHRDALTKAAELDRDHAAIVASRTDATTEATSSNTGSSTATPTSLAASQSPTPKADSLATNTATPTGIATKLDSTAKPNGSVVATPEAAPRQGGGRIPFLILVTLVAAALLLTCGAPRALLWLFFLLPTLLVRRVLGGLIPDSTALRGFSAIVTVGQAWLAGMVFVGWWETGCRDVHPVPLIGTLLGLVIAGVLPFDIPLLVNASTLAAMLIGWCTGKEACGESTQSMRADSYESPLPPASENSRS
jgi:hypothetical protein